MNVAFVILFVIEVCFYLQHSPLSQLLTDYLAPDYLYLPYFPYFPYSPYSPPLPILIHCFSLPIDQPVLNEEERRLMP